MDATVVKVGGSLALYPEKLRALCNRLSKLSKRHSIVIVPGGGEFADVVRDIDNRYNLSLSVTHRMAILGMDQYGFLLNDITADSCIATSLEKVEESFCSGKLPIFLPSKLLFNEDRLDNSWDVTSDSIAVYVAHRLRARKVVLVTDVDGICTSDPKKHSDAKLFTKLTGQQLLSMDMRSCVDKFLAKLLLDAQVDCYVVNGQFPERVVAILIGKEAVCTLIE